MKKNWLLKTLLVFLVVGVLAAGGYALYRVGYAHGAQGSFAGEMPFMRSGHFDDMPHAEHWDAQTMPFSRADGHMMDGYSRMPFGGRSMVGYSGFFFIPWLFHLLFWGVLIWLGYTLFKKSGWKLSKESAPAPVTDAAPIIEEEPREEA